MNYACALPFMRQDTLSSGCVPGFTSLAAETFCGLMRTDMAIVSCRIITGLPRGLACCNRWQAGSPRVDG